MYLCIILPPVIYIKLQGCSIIHVDFTYNPVHVAEKKLALTEIVSTSLLLTLRFVFLIVS